MASIPILTSASTISHIPTHLPCPIPPPPKFYSASLTTAGEQSPAVKTFNDEPTLTDLVLRVNGVKVAARGGNWGMDDSRKRVSREHLEPFFRLHREANMNVIRNWVGQDTEETFFQLADEYGMMVWNNFWASTQDYNVEPQDIPLFPRPRPDCSRLDPRSLVPLRPAGRGTCPPHHEGRRWQGDLQQHLLARSLGHPVPQAQHLRPGRSPSPPPRTQPRRRAACLGRQSSTLSSPTRPPPQPSPPRTSC